jgi:hypothetical protein
MKYEQLTAIAGAILSLTFSYVPGLRSRYEPLSDAAKRLVMLALLVAAAAGVYGLACTEWGALLEIGVECGKPGLARLVWSLVMAIITNQTTFIITPKDKGKRFRPPESGR